MNNSRKSIILFLVLAITFLVGIGMVSAATTGHNNTTKIDNSSTSQVSTTSTHQSNSTSTLQKDVSDNSKTENNTQDSNKTTTKTNTTSNSSEITTNSVNQVNVASLSTKNLKSASPVTTWDDLKSAVASGGTIELGSNIDNADSTLNFTVNNTVIDGQGYNISFLGTGNIVVSENLNVTIKNVKLDGQRLITRDTSAIDAQSSGTCLNLLNSSVDNFYLGAIGINSGNISECNFSNNRNNYGAAIYIVDAVNTYIGYSNFTNNTALYDGGAIYYSKSNLLTIENCTFDKNVAMNITSHGGTIFGSSDANITGSKFSNSSGFYGGVIYNGIDCNLNLNNDIFEDSFFTNPDLRIYGGVIYNLGILNINGSTFNRNNASDGGCIWSNNTVNINNSGFNYNNATYNGGVILNTASATLNITDSNFTNNSVNSLTKQFSAGGGVIYNEEGTLNITRNIFSNNSASTYGGAIFSHNGTVHTTNNTYEYNCAYGYGGAICKEDGYLYVNNDTYLNDTSYPNNYYPGYGGGAINSFDNLIVVNSSKFINNTAQQGGAINYYMTTVSTTGYPDLNITDSIFINNNATSIISGRVVGSGCGGAVYSRYASTNIVNSNFSYNHADAFGGAVESGNILTIINSTCENNTAKTGGAISTIIDEGEIKSYNTTYYNNTATYGGAYYSYGDVNSSGGKCILNNATYGGVMYINSTSTITLGDLIVNNTATDGGVVYTEQGYITIYSNGTSFSHNNATDHGGAIYIGANYKFDITIDNSNSSDVNARSGGLIYGSTGTIKIYNSNFTNINSTGSNGGVINTYQEDVDINLVNTNFNNTYANGTGGVIYILSGTIKTNNTNFTNSNATEGGVIYVNNSVNTVCTITTDYSNFINNTANNGGSIYMGGLLYDGTKVYLYHSNFNNTSAINGAGGAVWLRFGHVTTDYTNFTNSNATGASGVIHINGNYRKTTDTGVEIIYTHNTLNHSNFNNTCAQYGGIIHFEYGYVTISYSNITNSSAYNGNGGVIDSNKMSYMTLEYDIFNNTNATNNGGIIYQAQGTSDITYSNVTNSSAYNGNGGVIYQGYYDDDLPMSKMSLTNNIFNNTSATNNGGAVFQHEGYLENVNNNIFLNSNASKNGGLISIDYTRSYKNFINNTFDNIHALNGEGGVLYIYSQYNNGYPTIYTINLTNNTFNNTSATSNGGVIRTAYDRVVATDNNFTNTNASNGGIIFTWYINTYGGYSYSSGYKYTTFTNILKNNKIINSSAYNGNGGVMYIGAQNRFGDSNLLGWNYITLDNNSIENTSATGVGGVVYTLNGKIDATNNNFTNTNASNGGIIYIPTSHGNSYEYYNELSSIKNRLCRNHNFI